MNTSFNKIVLDILIQFITTNRLIAYEPYLGVSNNHKKYIFGNQNYGKSLNECYQNISNFDIFKPISHFTYNHSYYLIKFDSNYNLKVFSILLKQFLDTEYEELFFSSINKIIPIDFCIENQPWHIVKKFLTTKPLKSNGLPDVENSKRFFSLLSNYTLEEDFENSLITFCQFNKSLIKRAENQECLKIFIKHFPNSKLKSFYIELDEPLTQIKQNFFSIHINKKVLFSQFSNMVTRKKEPVDKLIEIFSALKIKKVKETLIQSLFIEQVDERFSELIIFISFSENISYSIEEYYLYLLDYFLNNKISVADNIEKISSYFFLNLKLPIKSVNKKEKTAKI